MHRIICYKCVNSACPRVGGCLNYIDGTRPPATCTASLERTFSNVTCLCLSNLANLNLKTAVMQQKAFTWVDFISPCGYHSLYIYNKVYASNGYTIFAYIGWLSLTLSLSFPWESMPWCVYISSLAWAGLTLLILTWGQCESLMIGIGARETYSHVFFVSIILWYSGKVKVLTMNR